MAKSLDCNDVTGYQECEYLVVAADNDEAFIINTSLTHAALHHPELLADRQAATEQIRKQIKSLLRQSNYDKQHN